MRTEIIPSGWANITTEIFEIRYIVANYFTVESWVESNLRLCGGKFPKNRGKCRCCKTSYKELSGYIHFVACKGKMNQHICDECLATFREHNIDIRARQKENENINN